MVPSASLVPARSHRAVHHRRAWCRSSPTSWARRRRRGARATSVQKCFRTVDIDIIGRDRAALHVLRDARQLQLRRLLQGRRHPPRLGAADRGPRGSTPSGCGSRCTSPTTRPTRSGSRSPGSASERVQRLGTRTTSGLGVACRIFCFVATISSRCNNRASAFVHRTQPTGTSSKFSADSASSSAWRINFSSSAVNVETSAVVVVNNSPIT